MNEKNLNDISEKNLQAKKGFPMLVLNILLMILGLLGLIVGLNITSISDDMVYFGVAITVISAAYLFIAGPIMFWGLKILKANEALVVTLFGKYQGTLKGEGYFFVNPFSSAVNPTKNPYAVAAKAAAAAAAGTDATTAVKPSDSTTGKSISLKAMTLNNNKQKVNDKLGNPIEIGVVVIWKVVDTAKAVFNVDHYMEFLSIQTDSALRNTARMYPYDVSDVNHSVEQLSLRGSSLEVSQQLQKELQEKVEVAGLEIVEAKITHLAYAPEIAAAMLQRQQASAIIDARKLIVEGAVGMVKAALTELSEQDIVQLDDERKASMVSNLLVVLCSNKDSQPIINAGSIY